MPPNHVALDPTRLEFSLYAFLKIYVYGRIARSLPALRSQGKPLHAAVPAPFSARRVYHLLTRGGTDTLTDLFDISPYYVRNRLQGLNHGTALESTGRGVRNSVTYRWNEPVDERTVKIFQSIHAAVNGRITLALDLFRLVDAFGFEPFSRASAVRMFQENRARCIERKWYRISTRTPAHSAQFTHYLRRRLTELADHGLLADTQGQLRLTPKGETAFHWLELFLYHPTDVNGQAYETVART